MHPEFRYQHGRRDFLYLAAATTGIAAFGGVNLLAAAQGGWVGSAVFAQKRRNKIYGQPGGCNVVGFETREACANLSGVMMGRLVPAPR
jgi:hypothetical protein